MARQNDFDDEDDDFEAEAVTPARRRRPPADDDAPAKSGSNTWMIIAIVAGSVGVVAVFGCCILIALLLPAVQAARNAARDVQSKNNLKQVGLASHNFHDTYSHFPPLPTLEEGGIQNQPHSWVTALLPYMELAPLYNIVQFNQPWDSPANQDVFSNRVIELIHPGIETTALPSGYGPAHYALNSQMIAPEGTGQGLGVRDFTDGTSNTMLAGTVAVGVKAWADPTNLRDPALGIGETSDTFNLVNRSCTVLMADGTVRKLSADTDLLILQAIATPSGGEVVPEF